MKLTGNGIPSISTITASTSTSKVFGSKRLSIFAACILICVGLTVVGIFSSAQEIPLSIRAPKSDPRPWVLYTLTSIPQRLPMINATLFSLLNQTYPPDEIVLSVPLVSRRFKDRDYELPPFLQTIRRTDGGLDKDEGNSSSTSIYPPPLFRSYQTFFHPKLTLLRPSEDFGPATKFIPTILRERALKRDSLIVIVDDDTLYPPNHLATLVSASQFQFPHSAIGLRGYCTPDNHRWNWKQIKTQTAHASMINTSVRVDVITANNGFLVRPNFFSLVNITFSSSSPRAAFYMDDEWINGILASNGISRIVIPIERDPRHRKAVQKKTPTLDAKVPGTRSSLNSQLLRHFGDFWHHCTIDPGTKRFNMSQQEFCCDPNI